MLKTGNNLTVSTWGWYWQPSMVTVGSYGWWMESVEAATVVDLHADDVELELGAQDAELQFHSDDADVALDAQDSEIRFHADDAEVTLR